MIKIPMLKTRLCRCLAIFLILALLCPSPALARKHKKRHRGHSQVTATSAILYNAGTGGREYAKNVDLRVFPASTTKVMTVLLVLERLPLDRVVTVKQRYTQVSETKLGVRIGEQYTVRDLVYASLLKSANDAVMVLAQEVAGSQSGFVQMMNRKARVIGARNTRFANAHGLPSTGPQYTTARDMALIFKEALRKPFFAKAVAVKQRIIYSKKGRRFFLKSHNRSLSLNWKTDIYGKTGFTRQAQSCFVGHYRRGGQTHIVAVFGCRKRWQDIKFIIERYGRMNL